MGQFDPTTQPYGDPPKGLVAKFFYYLLIGRASYGRNVPTPVHPQSRYARGETIKMSDLIKPPDHP